MCNRLPELMKNGDPGIIIVYYSPKNRRGKDCLKKIARFAFQQYVGSAAAAITARNLQTTRKG